MPNRVIENDAEQIVRLVFCRDGLRLVGADADGSIFVWDGPTLKKRWCLDEDTLDTLYDVAVGEDGRHAVVVGVGGYQVWDLDAGTRLLSGDVPAGRELQAVTFIGADRFAVVGDAERLWTFDLSGTQHAELEFGGERNESLDLLPDGRTLVCAAARQSGSGLQLATLIDGIPTPMVIAPIVEGTDAMSRVAVSSDGRRVAYTARTLNVVRLASANFDVCFDADGRATEHDSSRGLLEHRWSAPAFIDGHRLVCATPEDGRLHVFDFETKKRTAVLGGHGKRHVSALAVSRNRVVSAGADFSVRVTEIV